MKATLAADFMSLEARVWFLWLLLLWARPVVATDNYSYKADEYAIISGGRSPDSRWSVAAHGDGPYGYEDFDLYLTREPAHEKLAPLRTRDYLDTEPLSIVALWAPDSKHVAILNRVDRHVLGLRLFAVADGKVQSIKVPLLINLVGQQHLKPGVHYEFFSRLYRVTWQEPDRLTFEELDTLDASEPIFGAGLEAYLTLDRLGPERTFTNFSAHAACEITGRGELRLLSVKPLPLPKWPRTIVYSPHLRCDPQGGLHNTETTVSSLDAQKDRK
jgi:hypothetical protein